MVPCAGIRRPEHDFIQNSLTCIRLLYIQVIVANQTEQNAVAVDAIVSHHLLHGNLTGAGALVHNELDEICVTSHNYTITNKPEADSSI